MVDESLNLQYRILNSEFGVHMRALSAAPNLTQRVYDEVADAILSGHLAPGEHLVQEQLAETLGVSRQPVQQAMALLRADGLVVEAGKRGLVVAHLDPAAMRYHYEVRAVLDSFAARLAAERACAGADKVRAFEIAANAVLMAGAPEGQPVRDRIAHDEAFHRLIYDHSGNPVIAAAAEPTWRFLRRAMADVLRRATLPVTIWDEHRAIAQAIAAGEADRAEQLARNHAIDAARALGRILEQDAKGAA